MTQIGIFFGTQSGTTRLMAKKLSRLLGKELAATPLNVNRITKDDFMKYDAMILGTPTYSEGALPSAALGAPGGAWEEFLEELAPLDMNGKTIALYGTGDGVKHGDYFVDAMGTLHEFFSSRGARCVGFWSTEGYEFKSSKALVDESRFCGLAIDTANQPLLTDTRLATWTTQLKEEILQAPPG